MKTIKKILRKFVYNYLWTGNLIDKEESKLKIKNNTIFNFSNFLLEYIYGELSEERKNLLKNEINDVIKTNSNLQRIVIDLNNSIIYVRRRIYNIIINDVIESGINNNLESIILTAISLNKILINIYSKGNVSRNTKYLIKYILAN